MKLKIALLVMPVLMACNAADLSAPSSGALSSQGAPPAGPACNPAGNPFGGGAGTQADPYQVCSTAQWIRMGDQITPYWDKDFILKSDLNFTGIEMANYPITFYGVLDGDNHTLSNVTVTGSLNIGFEASLVSQNHGVIKNLIVYQPNMNNSVDASAGGLVTENSIGGLLENIHIVGGTVHGTGATSGGTSSAGGLAAYNRGTINNCQSSAAVSGYNFVGGLVGDTEGTSVVTNSTVTGTFSCTASTPSCGHIFGHNIGTSTNNN